MQVDSQAKRVLEAMGFDNMPNRHKRTATATILFMQEICNNVYHLPSGMLGGIQADLVTLFAKMETMHMSLPGDDAEETLESASAERNAKQRELVNYIGAYAGDRLPLKAWREVYDKFEALIE